MGCLVLIALIAIFCIFGPLIGILAMIVVLLWLILMAVAD